MECRQFCTVIQVYYRTHSRENEHRSRFFLSRLEKDPNKKIFLKIREHIPTKSIEVNIESTGNAH